MERQLEMLAMGGGKSRSLGFIIETSQTDSCLQGGLGAEDSWGGGQDYEQRRRKDHVGAEVTLQESR